ncbi:MAG: hypothetical protein JXA52_04960, partial [Planctomycetes bacterium]|nr:hypothetical protein [Planctomycetota bacterium]
MDSIAIAVGSALLYLIAYHTYGKFLAKKIFNIDNNIPTPAKTI